MGYPNYAAYSLENTMAKTPEGVYSFLRQLIKDYTPKADRADLPKFSGAFEVPLEAPPLPPLLPASLRCPLLLLFTAPPTGSSTTLRS